MEISHLSAFKPKVLFTIENDGFIVKTAENIEDLNGALKLRHQVFLEEGLNKSHETGLEFDAFDLKADHLLIIDKSKNLVVGTYRLIQSSFSDLFYSQSEFQLEKFLAEDGTKLELGRACTHIDYRSGRTVDLLWQGLSRYINMTKTRFLFGCSSVQSTDPEFIFSITRSLFEKEDLSFSYEIKPTEKYEFKNAQLHFDHAQVQPGVIRALPPLLRSYLHAGSKVHGFPALDVEFQCADFLTILDLRNLNKKFFERYQAQSGS